MIVDDSYPAVSDCDNWAYFDEFGCLALEDCVDWAGWITQNCTGEGCVTISAFCLLGRDDTNIDVEAASSVEEGVDCHELWFGKFTHNVEKIKY